MAGVKALRTIAEHITSGKRVAKGADDLALLDPGKGSGTLGGFDDLAEYQRVANKIESEAQIPATPAAVRQEIERTRQAQVESARQKGVSDPMAELRLDHQTRDATEFADRLNNQLRSTRFATQSILGQPSAEFEQVLQKSMKAHRATVDSALGGLQKNQRWVTRSDEWLGDSPYKGDLLFHTDRVSDPTRADSFIQFEEPREMGIHAGTNRAAESVINRGGVEDAMFRQEKLQSELDQIASGLNMSTKELNSSVARALENKLVAKFRKGEGLFDASIWDEAKGALTDFFTEINSRTPELVAQGMLQRLQDLPTPNTTPLLFRGRNGLLLEDTGGFSPKQVARQLEIIFPDDVDAITGAVTAPRVKQTKNLTAFIESKGFDHIIYHNSVEDKGSLSIINWNPELQRTPWHPDFTRDNPIEAAQQASAYILGTLGVGSAAVREE